MIVLPMIVCYYLPFYIDMVNIGQIHIPYMEYEYPLTTIPNCTISYEIIHGESYCMEGILCIGIIIIDGIIYGVYYSFIAMINC